MKALNFKSFFLVAVIAVTAFSSCKKNHDDVVTPQPAMEGTWTGKYGSGNITPNNYFSFIIKADGTLQAKSDDPNGAYTGTGTWQLDGENFTAVYQYAGQVGKWNVAAKVKVAEGTMNGSYGDGPTVADNGTYYMNRQ